MKISRKEWVKKIIEKAKIIVKETLVIISLIGINIFAINFFGTSAAFGFLVTTGFFSVFLYTDGTREYLPFVTSFIVFAFTLATCYYVCPDKYGLGQGETEIVRACAKTFGCFFAGAVLGFILSIPFCRKKQ